MNYRDLAIDVVFKPLFYSSSIGESSIIHQISDFANNVFKKKLLYGKKEKFAIFAK